MFHGIVVKIGESIAYLKLRFLHNSALDINEQLPTLLPQTPAKTLTHELSPEYSKCCKNPLIIHLLFAAAKLNSIWKEVACGILYQNR